MHAQNSLQSIIQFDTYPQTQSPSRRSSAASTTRRSSAASTSRQTSAASRRGSATTRSDAAELRLVTDAAELQQASYPGMHLQSAGSGWSPRTAHSTPPHSPRTPTRREEVPSPASPRCLSSAACCRRKPRRVQPSITVQRRCQLAWPCDQTEASCGAARLPRLEWPPPWSKQHKLPRCTLLDSLPDQFGALLGSLSGALGGLPLPDPLGALPATLRTRQLS